MSIISDRRDAAPARSATGAAHTWPRPGGWWLTTARTGPALRGVLPLLVVLAVAATAARPVLSHRMVAGHDALEHAMRVAEYARAIQGGAWWPAWAPNLGHGYGEPIFLFNPPLFYILASIPTLAGLPVILAINVTIAGLLVVAALGVYAWTRPILGRAGGVVAAAAYAWAPYVLLDVYVRQALTELTAVSVLPWALWGLARTCRAPGPRRIALSAVAIACLLLASTPATVVTAPVLIGQVLVLAGSDRARGTARGLVALGLATLLAAGFWIPVATERNLLRFDRLLANEPAYRNHFLETSQLLSSYWGYGISVPGLEDRMGFGLGEVHLALAALGAALLLAARVHRLTYRQGWLALAITALGIGMALPLSRFLWDRLPDLQYLQFPWRFLLLPALGCSFLAAVPAAVAARRHSKVGAALALGCTLALMAGSWSRATPGDLDELSNDDLTPMAIGLRDRGRGTAYEYETIWTNGRPIDPPESPLTLKSGSGVIRPLGSSAHRQRFQVTAWHRARLRLNTFYFPGWRVYVDGKERPIDYDNASALIEFTIDRGDHVVEATFEPTLARWLGGIGSLVGLLVVVALSCWPMVGNRRTAAPPLERRASSSSPRSQILGWRPERAKRRWRGA